MSQAEGPHRDAHPDRSERRLDGGTQEAAPARGGGAPRERPASPTPRPVSRGGVLFAFVLLGILAGAALGNLAGQSLPWGAAVGPGVGAGIGAALGFAIGTRRADAADRRIARRAEAEDRREGRLPRADEEHGDRD